jgi:hypothetical protein
MAFLSKRLRDHLTNRKRKIAKYNRDTHRVGVDIDIHACNECGGWETKGEEYHREETPVLHETFCSFYPSLANIALEHSLEDQRKWYGSKWDPNSALNRQVREACEKTRANAPKTPEEWLRRVIAARG